MISGRKSCSEPRMLLWSTPGHENSPRNGSLLPRRGKGRQALGWVMEMGNEPTLGRSSNRSALLGHSGEGANSMSGASPLIDAQLSRFVQAWQERHNVAAAVWSLRTIIGR